MNKMVPPIILKRKMKINNVRYYVGSDCLVRHSNINPDLAIRKAESLQHHVLANRILLLKLEINFILN
jgi:hypothetical protein